MYGLTDDEITAVREGQLDRFVPSEADLLVMADAMSDTPSNISDNLYERLRRNFSEEQMMELAASAALENFRARFNRVFDVGSDGLYRKGLRFKGQASHLHAQPERTNS
jgi:alkylhydroperoxidase family enzyme